MIDSQTEGAPETRFDAEGGAANTDANTDTVRPFSEDDAQPEDEAIGEYRDMRPEADESPKDD